MTELEALKEHLREFAREREWDQFHSPKNLAMALSVEAAELLEIFQWLTEEQSRRLDAKTHAAASDEIADVFIYLLRLADKLGIDPVAAAQRKQVKTAEKYPVEKSRGNNKKYTEL
ncbi:nucleotide pyrophosphohydrolase [Betaproteobacteria bacterium GR16-43]|nr:nucleotide pyrophosphohydrolase [Betaproteobacteria bacterium GR16-43]